MVHVHGILAMTLLEMLHFEIVLGKNLGLGINERFGQPEKKFTINFSKKKNKILLEFTLRSR